MEPGGHHAAPIPRGRRSSRRAVAAVALVAGLIAASVPSGAPASARARAVANDWTGYLGGPQHRSVAADASITPGQLSSLTAHWRFKLPAVSNRSRVIWASPVTWHGVVYVAGDTGMLYALRLSDATVLWKHDFGVIPKLHCKDAQGIVGTPAIRGDAGGHPFIYVNAPDGYLYELNGTTGATVWRSVVKIPSKTVNDTLPWSSPTLANGRVYVGISSNCDNPFVRGTVKSYDALSGQLRATAYTMPAGFVGAGVWTSVAADSSGAYVTTGSTSPATQSAHPPTVANDYDQYSIVKFDPLTLKRLGKWVAPPTTTYDPDFASSPILFNATIAGKSTPMVGACRKDGYFYAVRSDTMQLVWSRQVMLGTPGGQTNCLGGGVWDGARLFIAGGFTKIAGVDYYGSVRDVDPATGAIVWELGLPSVPLGAGAYNRSGILAYATSAWETGSNNGVFLVDPATGKVLRELQDTQSWPELAQPVWAEGQLFEADFDAVVDWSP